MVWISFFSYFKSIWNPFYHFFFFKKKDIHTNLALSALIQELLVYCQFKKFGCEKIIRLDQKESHEKECCFAPRACPHSERGCKFAGANQLIEEHLKTCVFEQLKDYLEHNDKTISTLQEIVRV